MRAAPARVLAAASFLAAVPVVAAALFFPVIFLAGPHSDSLPSFVQGTVIVVTWVLVVAVPAGITRWVFRRAIRGTTPQAPGA